MYRDSARVGRGTRHHYTNAREHHDAVRAAPEAPILTRIASMVFRSGKVARTGVHRLATAAKVARGVAVLVVVTALLGASPVMARPADGAVQMADRPWNRLVEMARGRVGGPRR